MSTKKKKAERKFHVNGYVIDLYAQRAGLSHAQVADACGVSLKLLHAWMHAENGPTASQIQRLAEVINAPEPRLTMQAEDLIIAATQARLTRYCIDVLDNVIPPETNEQAIDMAAILRKWVEVQRQRAEGIVKDPVSEAHAEKQANIADAPEEDDGFEPATGGQRHLN